jgi:hypothetical protein
VFAPRFAAYCSRQRNVAGPDAQRGLLASPFPGKLVFDPDNQTWRQAAGAWIGWRRDFHPAMIARRDSRRIKGYPVELADNRQWIIPVAYLESDVCCIPHFFDLDDSGKWFKRPDESFAALCALAARIWENIGYEDGMLENFTDEETIAAAALALAANYDITPAEAAAMRLFSASGVTAILGALIDVPGMSELARACSGANVTTARELNHLLWRAGNNPEYRPTFADAEKIKAAAGGN